MKDLIKRCEKAFSMEQATAIRRYLRFINGIWRYRIIARIGDNEVNFDYFPNDENMIYFKAYITK